MGGGDRIGTHFGPYHLRRLIGRGGMGAVYEAEDTVKARVVALKLMSQEFSQDPVFRERMRREARIAGRLQEPHVVPIHDFGEIDGQLYVEMRLIEGTGLDTLLNRFGPLVPPRAVAIVLQIAAALDAAHAVGLMHRDVKPQNILITQDDFAYLVDFGIASAATDEKLTQLGTAVETWKYSAPERFTGNEVTYRADIYSLACLLHECLTGSPPYRADSVERLVTRHLMEPPPQPSQLRPGITKAFDAVIARGMAKNPQDRYATAGDLATAARGALSAPDQDRDEVRMASPRPASGMAPVPPCPTPTVSHQTWTPPPSAPGPQPAWNQAQPARSHRKLTENAVAPGNKQRGSKKKQRRPKEKQQYAPKKKKNERRPSQPRGGTGDRVSSSVFAPPATECGDTFFVQVFAHLPEQATRVEAMAQTYDPAAQPRASFGLDSRVKQDERLSFELRLPGLNVDDRVQSLVWTGQPGSVQFGVAVPADFSPGAVVGTVTVSRDSVPMGHVKFKVEICEAGAARDRDGKPKRGDLHRYSRAFISYASADRKEVLKRTQMLAGVGIDFFQDLLSLEPGQRWERQLYREIDECDVFFLFWSSAAKKSAWVLKEVQYAMQRNGGDEFAPPEILPVILEGPPPAEAPPELAHLHMDDRMIYFMEPGKYNWLSRLRRRGS